MPRRAPGHSASDHNMNTPRSFRLLLALALAGLSAGARPADAIVVTPRGPAALTNPIVVNTFADEFANNGLCSLREAVESIRLGDAVGGCTYPLFGTPSIELSAGTCTLTRTGQITGGGLNLTGTIDMVGAGVGQTSIQQSAPSSRLIEVDGGGIKNVGGLTLRRVEVKGNTTNVSGGGLRNDGDATIISTTIRENHCGTGGGVRSGGTLFARDSSTLEAS